MANSWHTFRLGAAVVDKHKPDIGETVAFWGVEGQVWHNLSAEAVSAMQRVMLKAGEDLNALGDAHNAQKGVKPNE